MNNNIPILPLEKENTEKITSKIKELIKQKQTEKISFKFSNNVDKKKIEDEILRNLSYLEIGINDLQTLIKILIVHSQELERNNNIPVQTEDYFGYDHILEIDENHKIKYANKLAKELFNLESENIEKINFNNLNTVYNIEKNFKETELQLNMGHSIEKVSTIRDKYGKTKIFKTKWYLKENETNKSRHYIFIFSKINTIEKTNKKETIPFNSIAHDLRNTLTSVSAGLELIQNDSRNEEEAALFLALKSSIARGDQFLERIQSKDKQRNFFEMVYIPEIIDEIKNLISKTRKKIKIDFVQKGQIPNLNADPIQMHSLLENIIINAAESMPKGGRITISTELYKKRKTNEEFIKVEIKDEGIGIAKVNQKKIFENNYSTKNNRKNSGNGLSIVKNILTQHNGTIKIQSEINKGSNFIIHLKI
ncbi:MAG: ATP-binding protein [bacterium]